MGFPGRLYEYRRDDCPGCTPGAGGRNRSDGRRYRVGVFDAVDRDPRERIITVAYYTVLDSPVTVKGQDDAAQAGWFLLSDLPCLAFDHAEILKEAERLMEGRVTAGTAF